MLYTRLAKTATETPCGEGRHQGSLLRLSQAEHSMLLLIISFNFSPFKEMQRTVHTGTSHACKEGHFPHSRASVEAAGTEEEGLCPASWE